MNAPTYTEDAHGFDPDAGLYFVRQFSERVTSHVGSGFELAIETAVSTTAPLAHEAAIWGPNRTVLELDLDSARGIHGALGRLIGKLESLEAP